MEQFFKWTTWKCIDAEMNEYQPEDEADGDHSDTKST